MNGVVRAFPTDRRRGMAPYRQTHTRAAYIGGPVMPSDLPVDPVATVDYAERITAIAQCGDRAAFGELFEYFAPRLKSYFMRAGLASAQAEELAQDTMLNVWRKADQFDPARAGAATWIFVIARNLRIDLLRRQRSEQSALADPFELLELPIAADESVGAAEREARVRDALGKLSTEQASVIRLSFFSDAPHGEIARQLGIPLGTVKSRIRLAVARLRDFLGEM
jgi:RNA polymerase sigma-70 factor (ECF subfamily)